LAALSWNDNQKPEAEQVLGNTCLRLEQLQQKMIEKQKSTKKAEMVGYFFEYGVTKGIV
jgi:hypothetical protein